MQTPRSAGETLPLLILRGRLLPPATLHVIAAWQLLQNSLLSPVQSCSLASCMVCMRFCSTS
eukprot:1812152-Prorocentrum_lima.AAC.1